MRKTLNNQQKFPSPSPKSPKTQLLTHPPPSKLPPNCPPRMVKAICPNCEFHFKVEIKAIDNEDSKTISLNKHEDSLEKLIEKEYSQISSFSKGTHIEQSPVLKINHRPEIEDLIMSDINGLERLQLLNQLKEMQKSRMQESKVTVRFKPSPNDSPIQEFVESSIEVSPPPPTPPPPLPPIREFTIPDPPPQHQAPRMGKSVHEGALRETILSYYHSQQLLAALLNWVISNEHYRSLPSYLKLLIDQSQEAFNHF